MNLQRILNWIMGVRYDTQEEERMDFLRSQEVYNPAVCERLDCLNYGIVSTCYEETEGCKDYIKYNVKEK